MKVDIDSLPSERMELGKLIEQLKSEREELIAGYTALQQKVEAIEKENKLLRLENEHMKEIIAARNRRQYGRKSEKLPPDELQAWLFNEAEMAADPAHVPQKVKIVRIKEHTRKIVSRKALPADLPREIVLHDVNNGHCVHCNKELQKIDEDSHEEMSIIPLKVRVKKHIYPKYRSCDCEESRKSGDAKIISAARKKRIIPGCQADENLLAHLAVSKFCDGLPFYRMEKILQRYGLKYNRSTMCDQMIHISSACQDLMEVMWQEALSGPIVHMDETILQVLNELGRDPHQKSWMWVLIGRPEGKKLVLFHYHPNRSGDVARKLLKGYKGYVQSDGYSAYGTLADTPDIILVGCWSHGRRKFIDAKGLAEYTSLADEALKMIAKIFHIDSSLRKEDLDENEFVRIRREQTQPVLDELYCWLQANISKAPPSMNISKAINYLLNNWPKLIRYLDHAYLTPDNNIAENAIRPFVIGRKAWLFSNTPLGAHASALLYSLIESAKANGHEPYTYLVYLFTYLPVTPKDNLKELLPHILDTAKVKAFMAEQK